MSQSSDAPKLSTASRWIAGIVGVLLIGASIAFAYFPPTPSTVEHDHKDAQVKRVTTPTDLSSVLITVLLSGVGLLLFALNGYRFTRLSAAGLSADSDAVAEGARKQLAQTDDQAPSIAIDKSSEADPRPTQAPASTVEANDSEYAIYTLDDVPSKVIQDALSSWPPDQPRPASLAEFEFAARKKGQGNHAWNLKFRGLPLVEVTYGGYGKQTATVETV